MVLHTMDLIQFHSGCVSGGLSPYLKFGCLSVKTAWHAIDQCIRGKNHSQPPQSLHGQMPGPFFFMVLFPLCCMDLCTAMYVLYSMAFIGSKGFLMIVCVLFVWFYHVYPCFNLWFLWFCDVLCLYYRLYRGVSWFRHWVCGEIGFSR